MTDDRYPEAYRDDRRQLSEQPASRTRFYRDKRNGKINGICAGIADYTGFDVTLVRICMIAALFLSSGSVIPFYFIAGCSARDIRGRFKDIDRRLADIESYVTSENRSLAHEIEQLR